MARRTIIYIDDSEAELVAAKRGLAATDYELVTGSSIEDVAHAFGDVDFVLIDYHMPGLLGEEVKDEIVRRLKEQRPGDLPLFYLYTSDRALAGAYKDFGFDGQFIMKGNLDALIRQLDAAFRMARLRQMRPDDGG